MIDKVVDCDRFLMSSMKDMRGYKNCSTMVAVNLLRLFCSCSPTVMLRAQIILV